MLKALPTGELAIILDADELHTLRNENVPIENDEIIRRI